jgi:N,N'-diacetyllegionaminate synthase
MLTNRTLIIAEAGVNHNGDLALAKQLVDAAASAGADLVKFHSFRASRLSTPHAPKAHYQNIHLPEVSSQLEMLRELELTAQMHEALVAHCRLRQVGFFSSGFDIQSTDYIAQLGLDRFKIPSGEITNLPLLRHVGGFGKPVIISTGMSTLGEIEEAIRVLKISGTQKSQITVLHCNTEYPTPMSDVNLRAMLGIRHAFDVAVGYSDHTLGIEVPIAAVALGATVIEKHLTIDRNLPGPDHRSSLEAAEFKTMVSAIRNIEQALGDGVKRPSNSEQKNRLIVRKSLVASRAIKSGEQFSAENITTKRPGTGISPMRWDDIVGRVAKRDYSADELIEL